MERTAPVLRDRILYELKEGRNVLGNTLWGLVKIIEKIGDMAISVIAIPCGIPIVYKFNKDMEPIPPVVTSKPSATCT